MHYDCYHYLQLTHYINEPGEYALSKDVDVAFWLHSREYENKPLLTDAVDFVIVNSQQHDEFDAFKKAHTSPFHSHVLMVELLKFYCDTKCPTLLSSHSIGSFGRSYLHLSCYQIDRLVEWVYDLRDKYDVEDMKIFDCVLQQRSLKSLDRGKFKLLILL